MPERSAPVLIGMSRRRYVGFASCSRACHFLYTTKVTLLFQPASRIRGICCEKVFTALRKVSRMLCFDLQNRLCPDWERGVWHPGAGWCAVAGAFSLPLKHSVIHQGLGWRGDGRAVRWLMQRAALGIAACSAGRCSVLRFLPLSCGLAGGEDCRSLFFLSHKRKLRDGIHRAAFPASGLMAVCVPACGGERGIASFSCWRPMLFPW